MDKTFCILAHKVTNSLEFTVKYFSSFHENEVVIHVDKKANVSDFYHLEKKNVLLIEPREDVCWGGISMVLATLKLMKACNKKSFLFLLSGEDFPAMSNEEINNLIINNNSKNFIHFQDERNNYVDPYERFKIIYPKFAFKKTKSIKEKLLICALKLCQFNKNKKGISFIRSENIKLVKGSQWFAFNSDTVNKILTYLASNPIYQDIFEKSFCPDEMFFQTLINHLKCERFTDKNKMNDCLRYLDWTTGPDYPRTLDLTDFALIKKSGCMFARKASPTLMDSDFIKLIE